MEAGPEGDGGALADADSDDLRRAASTISPVHSGEIEKGAATISPVHPGVTEKAAATMSPLHQRATEKATTALASFSFARASQVLGDVGAYYSEEVDEEQPQGTFLDAAAMKEKVRKNMLKKKFDVRSFYKTSGVWQAIARDSRFESLTVGAIVSNALWIAVDTDYNDADFPVDSHPIFQLVENLYCAFFSFEWLTRLVSFRRTRDCLRDRWFIFDGVMAVLMVSETWLFAMVLILCGSQGALVGDASILSVARLIRLCRVFRMAKLLRALPELFVLLKGLFASFRHVFFALMLLALMTLTCAIAFTQLASDTALGADYFPSVLGSAYFLLVHGTLFQGTDSRAERIREEGGAVLVAFFWTFILFAAILTMNMLIGVLVDVVKTVADAEREEMLVAYVEVKLTKVVALIDEDGGGTISRDEFMQIFQHQEAIEAIKELGVDVIGLVDYADLIFGEDAFADFPSSEREEVELTMAEFMEVMLSLRGSNSATVKDVVDLRKCIRTALQSMRVRMDRLEVALDVIHALCTDIMSMMRDICVTMHSDADKAWQASAFLEAHPAVRAAESAAFTLRKGGCSSAVEGQDMGMTMHSSADDACVTDVVTTVVLRTDAHAAVAAAAEPRCTRGEGYCSSAGQSQDMGMTMHSSADDACLTDVVTTVVLRTDAHAAVAAAAAEPSCTRGEGDCSSAGQSQAAVGPPGVEAEPAVAAGDAGGGGVGGDGRLR